MGLIKTVTEGGQIWAHRIRMARQVFKIASTISLFCAAALFAYRLYQVPFYCYQAAGYYLKAYIAPTDDPISVDSKFWAQVRGYSKSSKTMEVSKKDVLSIGQRYLIFLKGEVQRSGHYAFQVSSKVFLGTLLLFLIKGFLSRRNRHIDGKKLVSARWLAFKLRMQGKASPIQIGPLPLVKNTETQHILISGTTGSGKSTAYHSILPTIRQQKQRAIVVDTSGEYVKRYYNPKTDHILNPFRPDSQSWHPWCECKNALNLEAIVENFIPYSHHPVDRFWVSSAQDVLRVALEKLKEKPSIRLLEKTLRGSDLHTLAAFFKGTNAETLINMAADKTASSVLANVTSYLKCLTYLPDTNTPFSIHDWVKEEKEDSWLFLTCSDSELAGLRPLLTVWVSVAISSLIQLEPSNERRLWLIADEIPRLRRLSNLEDFLTLSRKYGGCGLLAVQNMSQLETIYGRDVAKTFRNNSSTRIVFAEYDAEEALITSKSFGEREIQQANESLSYGAHEHRDGVSISYQNKLRPVVSTNAIQSLKKLEAFVKLPGNLPMTKIKVRYQKERQIKEEGLKQAPPQAVDQGEKKEVIPQIAPLTTLPLAEKTFEDVSPVMETSTPEQENVAVPLFNDQY